LARKLGHPPWQWGSAGSPIEELDAARDYFRAVHEDVGRPHPDHPRAPSLQARVAAANPLLIEFAAMQYIGGRDTPAPYLLVGTVSGRDGRLTVSTLLVLPILDDAEVNSATLRGVSIPSLLAALRTLLPHLPRWAEITGAAPPIRALARAAKTFAEREPPRRGRPPLSDELLAQVADQYLRLQSEGHGKGILIELARAMEAQLGRPVPRETVRHWVHRARRREFLTAGTQGRAGALPGNRLRSYWLTRSLEECPDGPTQPFTVS
jgi:hypothetical protein